AELRLQVASPSTEVDAAQYDLAVAGPHQGAGFIDGSLQLHGAALPAHAGNYAKRAAIVAAVLEFQIGTSLFRDAFSGEHGCCNQLGVGKDVAHYSESRPGERHIFQRYKICRLRA